MQAKGGLKTTQNGEIEVDITKPENLKGLEIRTENDEVFIKFKGIETKVSEEKLPTGASVTLVKKVFTEILNGENLSFERVENGYKAQTDSEFGKVEILLGEDEKIKKIEFKNQGLVLKLD